MKSISPFQYNRWETDDLHLIWLPPKFNDWEKKKCVYLTGARGSGKTTLLRGFEWFQRLKNESLISQLGKDPFEKKYIGVYLNMPDYVTEQFLDWPQKKESMTEIQIEEERGRLFALYIEYQSLQLLIKAIQTLRGEGIFNYSPEQEEKIVREILQERPEIVKYNSSKDLSPRLNNLRLRFKQMHENIRYCAINKIELTPKAGYSTLQMGKLLEEVTTILLKLCTKEESRTDRHKNLKEAKWTLKVCLDQNESPAQYQQKAINTMIARLETNNITFAIASLSGNLDITNTFIPRHTLTDADRKHHRLDKMTPSEFHEFVTAVTKLRFEQITKTKIKTLNLRKILGEWDINALLLPTLRESENPEVRDLIKRSKDNIGRLFFDFKRKNLPLEQMNRSTINDEDNDELFIPPVSFDKDIPPIYQTYLIEKLKLSMPDEESEKHKIRSQKSREIRKKMVSAMLCLCKEYNLSVPYAGYYMVISMSDNCIRDYLRQMHEIYISSKCDIEKFLNTKIHPRTQNTALFNASKYRYEGIGQITPCYPSEVMHLIDSLGKITAYIQSAYNDASTLKTTEKGRFKVNYLTMKNKTDREKLQNILRELRDCHYIRIIGEVDDENEIIFRLHKLFAPYFKFSYRGAYSNITINGEDLLKLCAEKDIKDQDKIIKKIVGEIVKIEKISTLDLWFEEKND